MKSVQFSFETVKTISSIDCTVINKLMKALAYFWRAFNFGKNCHLHYLKYTYFKYERMVSYESLWCDGDWYLFYYIIK